MREVKDMVDSDVHTMSPAIIFFKLLFSDVSLLMSHVLSHIPLCGGSGSSLHVHRENKSMSEFTLACKSCVLDVME